MKFSECVDDIVVFKKSEGKYWILVKLYIFDQGFFDIKKRIGLDYNASL